MVVQKDPDRRYLPLRLLRNTTYPSYQLYAVAGSGKAPPEAVLAIAVLETMSWLRSRFRDLDVPRELTTPESSAYAGFDLKSLQSFRIDMGYMVEVVWLPDELIWTLQLTEPDLGPRPGEIIQERPPVPGRLFETNVAFRILSGQVECGFRTVVSDPEGTTALCEVYRLAMIKHLARNPLVGLKQGWPIVGTAHQLSRMADLDKLQAWLKDRERMMLAVIVAESEPDQPAPLPQPTLEDLQRDVRKLPTVFFPPTTSYELPPSSTIPSLDKLAAANLRGPGVTWKKSTDPNTDEHKPVPSPLPILPGPGQAEMSKQPGDWLIDIKEIAHYKMGYAQIFALPLSRIADFQKITGQAIAPGDVLLIEPLAFGGDVERILRQQIASDTKTEEQRLNDRIQKAPKGKPMTFGSVHFLPAAKEIEQTNRLRQHLSNRELQQASNERANAAEHRHRGELQAMSDQHRLLNDRINRLKEQIFLADLEKEQLRARITTVESDFAQRLAEKDSEIMRLQALLCRPKNQGEIISWAEEYLGDGLFFHTRAKREMDGLTPGEVDVDLLCDALEYLATDYRDKLLGIIDEDECRNRSSRKYNRGFDVAKLTGTTIDMYPAQYKIKYYPSRLGKPVDSVLDLHLRIGNTNENLLRIYFLYDKEKKKLVIGSMPRHLNTVSYK